MEQILQKLSEIEITAQRIMQDADRTKAALSGISSGRIQTYHFNESENKYEYIEC